MKLLFLKSPTHAVPAVGSVPRYSMEYMRPDVRVDSAKQGYYGENAKKPDWSGAATAASEPVVPQVSYYDGDDSFSASKSSQSVYLKDSFYRSSEMDGLERGASGKSRGRSDGRPENDGTARSKKLVRKAVGAFERVVKTNAKLKYKVDIDGELVRMMLGKGGEVQ